MEEAALTPTRAPPPGNNPFMRKQGPTGGYEFLCLTHRLCVWRSIERPGKAFGDESDWFERLKQLDSLNLRA